MPASMCMIFSNYKTNTSNTNTSKTNTSKTNTSSSWKKSGYSIFDINNIPKGCKTCGKG